MLLPEIVARLAHEFPNCLFSIKTALVAELYKGLDEKDLDVIVTDAPEDAQPYRCEFLRSESSFWPCPLLSPSRAWTTAAISPPFPFRSWPATPSSSFETGTYLGTCLRLLWELENISPKVRVEVSHVDTAIQMAALGLGATVVPEFVVRYVSRDERLKYFYIDRFSLVRQLTVVYKKNHPSPNPRGASLSCFPSATGITAPRGQANPSPAISAAADERTPLLI